jgi:hypothetical protein
MAIESEQQKTPPLVVGVPDAAEASSPPPKRTKASIDEEADISTGVAEPEATLVTSPLPIRSTMPPPPLPNHLLDPKLRSPSSSKTPGMPGPCGSATTAPGRRPRVKWTEIMEETLLQALEEVVKRGRTADGFKKEHWREVAEEVRAVYHGPAELDWERAKSKFEDKYRPLWGKWTDFLASGLSGWTENEEGLPQSSEEIMDKYFSDHPEFRSFRYSLPTGYHHLIVILGDRVATG